MTEPLQSEDTRKCLCPSGSNDGVLVKQMTANRNVEVWASCSRSDEEYELGCNHLTVSEGTSFRFPSEEVKLYTDDPHFHYLVREDPHNEWTETEFTKCKCDTPF